MRIPTLALAVVCFAAPARAQEVQGAPTPQASERMHEELRALRDGLVKATNESNIDLLLTHLHPNVVVTWQNAEVSRGHAGVRDVEARRVPGFPYLRVDRFLASFRHQDLSPAQLEARVDRLVR